MQPRSLDPVQIRAFIEDGYVRLDGAFPRETADEARAILWRKSGCDPGNPATWTQPVVRIGDCGEEPFRKAANTPVLREAFDQLVGERRWLPRTSLGTFPIRFPLSADPGDTGWHIDASFAFDSPDFMSWRTNVLSTGRALLMLFLFSDVDERDAPTRIRVGSHLDIARRLAPAGAAGLSLRDLAGHGFEEAAGRPIALATGSAGTVYLCHPFLVHAAQPHRGTRPRFMAQPPLLPAAPFRLGLEDGDRSPVETAIRNALSC
ncbi:MAG TPA: phytanoyl-CoA dioxygenase family protein [Aliidongia sp.]|uniref:phytanoyl-CoA dioxygenase family protein n=1 Tax=Aliidongia sp. TaxID=1914230 RepID=UPI002DDCE281|nr:phytanoyl-CoA dioxygenase family protein [Aliidongia sp.]HEV2678096.1 phytanoyl-CoA dioxygenase family protein [Aliidongia sp.]